MDSLEKRVKTFFSNAKKMKPLDKENEYELIRKDYYKTLEDAGKVTAINMHRYVMVFYVMIPRNLVGGYQHFGETY
jgi:inhibitor of growth protein 3